MSKVIELDDESFDSQLGLDGLSVILFWTTWCGHCPGAVTLIGTLADEMPDIHFAMVDKDAGADCAGACHVSSVPSWVFIKNGKILYNKLGGLKREALVDLIRKMR